MKLITTISIMFLSTLMNAQCEQRIIDTTLKGKDLMYIIKGNNVTFINYRKSCYGLNDQIMFENENGKKFYFDNETENCFGKIEVETNEDFKEMMKSKNLLIEFPKQEAINDNGQVTRLLPLYQKICK